MSCPTGELQILLVGLVLIKAKIRAVDYQLVSSSFESRLLMVTVLRKPRA